MKKIVSLLTVVFIAAFLFAACSKENPPRNTQSDVKVVTPQSEEKPVAEESLQTQPAPEENTPNNPKPSEDNFIGEERAKEIALEKAGLSAGDVIFDRVELDFDDGVWEYEVEFRQGRVEYDADIKADDGTILKWEKDIDD